MLDPAGPTATRSTLASLLPKPIPAPATARPSPGTARRPSSKREQGSRATSRSPSTTELRLPVAPASAVRPRRSPHRPGRAAPRTQTAPAERTVVALVISFRKGLACVPTTSAPPIRSADPGRRAYAAARHPTAARTFVPPRAIASSTRIAVQAVIARLRLRAVTERSATIVTQPRTPASTTRIALPPTREPIPAQSRRYARTARMREAGRACSRFAARRDGHAGPPSHYGCTVLG
jgi:hypothetical protein